MIKKMILLGIILISLFALFSCVVQETEKEYFLPDMTGKNVEQVQNALMEFELDINILYIINNEIKVGRFISYGDSFSIGDPIDQGTEIDIYFVKQANILPSLTGLDEEGVTLALNEIEVDYDIAYIDTNSVVEGLFVSFGDLLTAGTVLPIGEHITVYLAKNLIALPDLTGLSRIEIIDVLDQLNLNYAFQSIQNNTYPEDSFISYGLGKQTGDFVAQESDIIVNLAVHVNMLPNLTGLTKTQAQVLLTQIDVSVTYVDVISNTVSLNKFVSYGNSLQAGMIVEESTPITVFISKGPNALPYLVGLNETQIRLALDAIDVNLTILTQETNSVKEGQFVAYMDALQDGDILSIGASLTVYIAKNLPVLPDLTGLNEANIILELSPLDIDYVIEETNNYNISQGLFVSYGNNLLPGDTVSEGSQVIIYIAIHINMLPDLSGLNQTEAFALLLRINIIIDVRNVLTNEVPEGYFVSYGNNLQAGTIVNNGQTVIVNFAQPIIIVNRGLIISKYLEGSLFNRAIELFNTTSDPIDLSLYKLSIYTDGSEQVSVPISLSGIIEPHTTYTIAYTGSSTEILSKADMQTPLLIFNGNDAISLDYYNQVRVDIIGVIGWSLFYIQDQTLIRNSTITSPNPSFVIGEWNIYISDYIEPFGTHPISYPTTFTYDSDWLSIPFTEKYGMVQVQFVSNNDGDTAQFSPGFLDDNRVRFIGVDTPETGSGTVATLARQYVYNRLSNATSIYIQHDPASGNIDAYGRYLGLIWADGALINYELVLRGYSQNNYSDSLDLLVFNNVPLSRWMANAENYAKTNRLGVWAI
jgi:beta-lactam-binding protein with PASTA domain/endonuclease YncB( thermonuclease family)